MGNRQSNKKDDSKVERRRREQILSQQEASVLYGSDKDAQVGDTVDIGDENTTNLDKLRACLMRENSMFDPVDAEALEVKVEEHNYPFENLIMEGGGNKGLAYVGAVQCLEEHQMMGQIKRVAGASAGAITAALVALGYSSGEIFAFLSENIESVFLDHSCGYLSLLPNLVRHFGWNPGKKIHRWFGDKIKPKSATNNPDMTFYDLYKEKGMELCVMVTNLNLMSAQYCHPKTTPDMPIRDALRMSMSIPGVFTAMRYDNHGQQDTYVDGGVLCNYPIHCFDGWFLSMDSKDSFLLRCQPLKDLPILMDASNRFYPPAKHKTIGFLLYDDTEKEIMRYNLEKRIGCLLPTKPERETKLYKKKMEDKERLDKAEKEHARVAKAVEAFMLVLHKNNSDEIEYITKEELKAALEDEGFPTEHKDRLFGKDCDLDTAFKILDKDGNNKIAFFELVTFIEEHGIRMQTRFQGYGRRDINSFFSFLNALQGTLLTNLKYVFVGGEDEGRTVGINTGHVGTSNYSLDEEDRAFATARGYNATHAFLRYFVVKNPDAVTKKESSTTNIPAAKTEDATLDIVNVSFENTCKETHKLIEYDGEIASES